MPNIKTLVPDIYSLVRSTGGWFSDQIKKELSDEIPTRLQSKFNEGQASPTLRLSKMGPWCPHALWHSIHSPEKAEPLPPWVTIKLGYGHIVETYAIALAKAAGHQVTGEQDELVLDGILGHRDCVIDGCVVDVKSTTSIGFGKFEDGTLAFNDGFGYLDQLDGYVVASADDPLVTVKDRGYLLAVDKNLGHMHLYEHRVREDSIRERIKYHKQIVERDTPPRCECSTEPIGKSGNIKLGTRASYSAFKHTCFPNLRTFLYASGPVYLTHVAKRPEAHIIEIDRHGKVVYN